MRSQKLGQSLLLKSALSAVVKMPTNCGKTMFAFFIMLWLDFVAYDVIVHHGKLGMENYKKFEKKNNFYAEIKIIYHSKCFLIVFIKIQALAVCSARGYTIFIFF